MSTAVITKVKTVAEIIGTFNSIISPNLKDGKNQIKNKFKEEVRNIIDEKEKEGKKV